MSIQMTKTQSLSFGSARPSAHICLSCSLGTYRESMALVATAMCTFDWQMAGGFGFLIKSVLLPLCLAAVVFFFLLLGLAL